MFNAKYTQVLVHWNIYITHDVAVTSERRHVLLGSHTSITWVRNIGTTASKTLRIFNVHSINNQRRIDPLTNGLVWGCSF